MTGEDRGTAIALELRRASAVLAAALAAPRLLRGADLHNDALSRLDYALFHTMTTLLLTEGVEPRRHRALPGLADYERPWEAPPVVAAAAFAEIEPIMERRVVAASSQCSTESS